MPTVCVYLWCLHCVMYVCAPIRCVRGVYARLLVPTKRWKMKYEIIVIVKSWRCVIECVECVE